MALTLEKGGRLELDKGLVHILAGCGWDANERENGYPFDLDLSVFALNENGKCTTEEDVVFYGGPVKNPDGTVSHRSGSIKYMGDNRTGAGEGDDEQIIIDLNKVPSHISRIVFTVTIYKADQRNQTFGKVHNAYIRLVNEDDNEEVLRYDLGDEFSVETAIVFAELYRYNNNWKFNAIGSGFQGGLAALCAQYGVETE